MIETEKCSSESEGKIVTVPALRNLLKENKTFILFGGTMGAGKTHWANENLKGLIPIEDPDETSLSQKMKNVNLALAEGRSVVDMGTMANARSSVNKIKKAKNLGYTTVTVLVMTDPEVAVQRNRQRIANGGRGVIPEMEGKIVAQYYKSTKSFLEVIQNKDLDFFMVIRS